MHNLLFIPLGAGVLSLLFAFYKIGWVKKQDPGDTKLQEIGKAIKDGAMAFMSREYKVLSIIVVAVAALLFFSEKGSGRLSAVSFLVGAIFSGLAGLIGMKAATLANTRTAHGAKTSLNRALKHRFHRGVGHGPLGCGSRNFRIGGAPFCLYVPFRQRHR